ncbi:unnamed protein product [Urochloa humidicola]
MDSGSIPAVITGCEGVFHVASPVPSGRSTNPEAEIVEPAVTGTLNVLKACYEAKVNRVVLVSSITAVANNPNCPSGKVFDEESWSDEEHCRKNEVSLTQLSCVTVDFLHSLMKSIVLQQSHFFPSQKKKKKKKSPTSCFFSISLCVLPKLNP